jgi:hypothetical protein
MTLYVNYDQAQQRLDDTDLFSVRALAAIHRAMLENANQSLKPLFPFDIRYFYDTTIRAIADHYEYNVPSAPETVCGIVAMNIPDVDTVHWRDSFFGQSSLADRFIQLVLSESEADGCPFDLGFACAIAAKALDADALEFIRRGMGRKAPTTDNAFDDWLDGFSIPEA